MEVGSQGRAPAFLFAGKAARIHCAGGWVGRGAGPSRCWEGSNETTKRFKRRILRPVAEGYTAYALPATNVLNIERK
jgi:hypothetical protein